MPPEECASQGMICVDGACVTSDDACIPGESFDADDGCNTCTCPESGLKSEAPCTKIGCVCGADMPCGDGYFCDYANDDCGVWGSTGLCAASPEACIAGGPGACGCGGASATNGCELQSGGQDVFSYGGCSLGEPDTFACGEVSCQSATEFCAISMNDVAGPMEPVFYNSCAPLPDDCGQGDCGCVAVDAWSSCYDGTGMTVVFYPGG